MPFLCESFDKQICFTCCTSMMNVSWFSLFIKIIIVQNVTLNTKVFLHWNVFSSTNIHGECSLYTSLFCNLIIVLKALAPFTLLQLLFFLVKVVWKQSLKSALGNWFFQFQINILSYFKLLANFLRNTCANFILSRTVHFETATILIITFDVFSGICFRLFIIPIWEHH